MEGRRDGRERRGGGIDGGMIGGGVGSERGGG